MQEFIQQVINGLTIGSVYALVALGYTMVYGVLRLINFAHGDLFMVGAYLAFSLVVSAGLMHVISWPIVAMVVLFLLVMGFVGVTGVTIERIAYRPLRRASRLAPVVSALGMSVFLENAVMLIYGPKYQNFPTSVLPEWSFYLAGVKITLMRLLILLVSIVLMAGMYVFVQRTRLGAAMRAVALDHDTSRLMGIDVDHIITLVFLIGPALGAAAGVMVGMYYGQIDFTMGWIYGLKAFTAAILGGIGNIPGAMVGGFILGLVEAMAAGYISAAWKDAFSFAILIVILLVRPTGLLGERVAEKV